MRVVVALLLALVPSASASAAPAPARTLATVGGVVAGLAQDGGGFAWSDQGGVITFGRIDGGRRIRIVSDENFSPCCEQFVLAREGALWLATHYGHDKYQTLATLTAADRRARFLEATQSSTGFGDDITAVAGDGDVLVYSKVRLTVTPGCADAECTSVIKSGAVWRVVNGHKVRVPRVPGVPLLAAAGRRIAVLVPSRDTWRSSLVQIRQVSNGIVVRSLRARDHVHALAFAGDLVAVLSGQTTKRLMLEWFSVRTGKRLGAGLAPPRTVARLSVSGPRVLYGGPRVLRVLDMRTRRSTIVASGAAVEHFSIEGDRVMWVQADAREPRSYIRMRML